MPRWGPAGKERMKRNLRTEMARRGTIVMRNLLCLGCVVWVWSAAPPAPAAVAPIRLKAEEARVIGRKIWRNECAGTVEGLTSWNKGETFASLGIGHFIWYPAGQEGPFEESWPKLIAWFEAGAVPVPAWLLTTRDCPWPNREAFQAEFQSPRMRELRQFLEATVEGQTAFIVRRLEAALPKMTAGVSSGDRRKLQRQFAAVAGTGSGIYALIDYVNFKGEGIKKEERYQGQGWGLAQVLLEMEGRPEGNAAAVEFGRAATRVLTRRVKNAPRDESMWLPGWSHRCATYGQAL